MLFNHFIINMETDLKLVLHIVKFLASWEQVFRFLLSISSINQYLRCVCFVVHFVHCYSYNLSLQLGSGIVIP